MEGWRDGGMEVKDPEMHQFVAEMLFLLALCQKLACVIYRTVYLHFAPVKLPIPTLSSPEPVGPGTGADAAFTCVKYTRICCGPAGRPIQKQQHTANISSLNDPHVRTTGN